MTSIQVQYWANQEQKRHNIAMEGETYRHNVVTENQNQQSLTEIARHNQVNETLGYLNLAETSRHNQQVEGIQRDTLEESRRHNIATERETHRHNVAAESISRTQATASMIQAEAARKNADTNEKRVASENQLRAAQLQYQQLTNQQTEWETTLRLDPVNQEVEYFFSTIGSALTGMQGKTGAAGGLMGTLAKIIL